MSLHNKTQVFRNLTRNWAEFNQDIVDVESAQSVSRLSRCRQVSNSGMLYTDHVSKLNSQARKRPEFMPDAVGAEAAQLERVGRCKRAKIQWQADDA